MQVGGVGISIGRVLCECPVGIRLAALLHIAKAQWITNVSGNMYGSCAGPKS